MTSRALSSFVRGQRNPAGSAALFAALLMPLRFTAPADSVGPDAQGRVFISANPVQGYHFQRRWPGGVIDSIPGYRDASGNGLLEPHAPGTHETVWVPWQTIGGPVTITVRSSDTAGNLSGASNNFILADAAGRGIANSEASAGRPVAAILLKVPNLEQSRERCGQASLAMVLRYYGANAVALQQVESAYDPVLRGSLITDLAGAARRAGFRAEIRTLTGDSLIELLDRGVPAILLYQNGTGPLTVRHFGVLTGWDASRATFTLNDGTAAPHEARRADLQKRWSTAGSQALVVTRMTP